MESRTKPFHPNNHPKELRTLALTKAMGMPPSNVPAGQRNLQNAGVAIPCFQSAYNGSAKTKTKSTTYFNRLNLRVKRLFGSFLPGILYSNSWIRPNGQKKAHTARPRMAPKMMSKPTTYKGKLGSPFKEACKEPMGQAPTAPGQE